MALKGISGQEQLSRRINVSLPTVKRIMREKDPQAPTGQFIAGLTLYFKIPMDHFVEAVWSESDQAHLAA